MTSRAHCVGLGGTFDHFHYGHRAFLTAAADVSEKLMVGVTVDELSQNKTLAELIEPYETRAANVQNFFAKLHRNAEVFPLHDAYGPTIDHSPIDALAVTEFTQHGAAMIIAKRAEKGLPSLPVTVVPMLHDTDGDVLSSTAIRQGVVDRQGNRFHQIWQRDHVITDQERAFFQQLQGKVVTEPLADAGGPVVVVGDVVLETFRQHHWSYTLGIFDGKSQRADRADLPVPSKPAITVNNPAGVITAAAGKLLEMTIHELTKATAAEHFFVNGEEDLMTLVAVLSLPLNGRVYYGHRDHGMVCIETTEENKAAFYHALTAKA